MSVDPGSLISLIEKIVKVCNYVADVRHSSQERRRLLGEVQALRSQLEDLRKLVETPVIAGDADSIGQLAKLLDSSRPFDEAVKETLRAVEVALGRRTSDPNPNKVKVLWWRVIAALWWTVDKAAVNKLFSDLQRYQGQITSALQHDTFNHIITEHRLKVAKFISESDYTGPQRSLIAQRLSGTASWVLEHSAFIAWRDDKKSSNVIWCHGNPGVGKSVLAALVVDHLRSRDNVVLSVFCRYFYTSTTAPSTTSTTTAPDFTTPSSVLCGLLRQLIEQSPNVLPSISMQYLSLTPPNPDDVSVFLAEMAASHTQPIYIVIDALDECIIALDLLHAIQQLGPLFRILITSRPIFQEIERYTSIQIRASDHDILVAVDTTLPKLGAWLDDTLKNTIQAKIVEKANGMFLLASRQLRELERDVTCRRDVITILGSLPRTLDDAYKLTFQRIREQGVRKMELACRALAIAALHWNWLYIEAVQHLLAEGDKSQYTDIEVILQCSHGLVRRTDDSKFEFIHYSVHQYTTTHWSGLFPEHPNRSDLCLKLGYSVLIRTVDQSKRLNIDSWGRIVREMRKPQDLEQVVSLLSTSEAGASLVVYYPELAPLVHDPLLIACYCEYETVVEHMIQTAPPDVQRFNEALRVCRPRTGWLAEQCIAYINRRPEMRVNSEGVVVAIDPDGEGH